MIAVRIPASSADLCPRFRLGAMRPFELTVAVRGPHRAWVGATRVNVAVYRVCEGRQGPIVAGCLVVIRTLSPGDPARDGWT